MADVNSCIFTGRLGADPELRTTAGGVSVCAFDLAVNRPKAKDAKESETDWLPMVAWRQTAEFMTRFLRRGSKVTVEASARTRTWTGKDGKTHKVVEFQVEELVAADGKLAPTPAAFSPSQSSIPPPQGENGYADFGASDDGELPF